VHNKDCDPGDCTDYEGHDLFYIRRAREAQQERDQKHDVQLEIEINNVTSMRPDGTTYHHEPKG
jgi:hypothetical protein